jgi:hypothetical protein
MELVAGEGDAGGRPQQVGAAVGRPGVERVRVREVLLVEHQVPLPPGDVHAPRARDPALVERVVGRVPERDEVRLAVVVRGGEPGDHLDGRLGVGDRPVQRRAQPRQLVARRDGREAPDPDRHRVDRPPAEEGHDRVAQLLEPQAALDQLAVIGRHRERGRVAHEVGRVQQVHMERVALDPLAEVEQPAQGADLGVDLHAVEVLERVHRGHLVRDRADAADAGDDVQELVAGPPDHEALEVAGRLEDRQPGLGHLAVAGDPQPEAALALHPGDVANREVVLHGRNVATVHRVPPAAAPARRRAP